MTVRTLSRSIPLLREPPVADFTPTFALTVTAPRASIPARTRPVGMALEEPDTPALGGLTLADLGPCPAFEDVPLWNGTPNSVSPRDRALLEASLRPKAWAKALIDSDSDSEPGSPCGSIASSSADAEQFYASQWRELTEAQRALNERGETTMLSLPTHVDLSHASRAHGEALSDPYVEGAIALVGRHTDAVRDLISRARDELKEACLCISQRVLSSEPPSLRERQALQGLRRTWNQQAALLTRISDAWHGVQERCQDMSLMVAHEEVKQTPLSLPISVRDPLSLSTRHFQVKVLDLDLLEGCGPDLAESAGSLRGKELAPLITDIHRVRARLQNLMRWNPSLETRCKLDKAQPLSTWKRSC